MKKKAKKHQHTYQLVETKKGLKARCSCGVYLAKPKPKS